MATAGQTTRSPSIPHLRPALGLSRPGSALYVVWNENRAETEEFGDFRFGRDLRAIYDAPSHDVFLVKMSYWLPM